MIKVLLSGLALFVFTYTTSVKAQNAGAIETPVKITAVKDGNLKIPVLLNNVNAAEIKSLTLTVDIAGKKQLITITPDIIRNTNNSAMFYINTEAPSSTGIGNVSVTIDAINGRKTDTEGNTSRSSIMTVSRKVPHKVVVEEYTAIWCQTCPSGIVGIERSKINYGEKILVLTVHHQDPMTCRDYNDLTNIHYTTPRATIDRDKNIGDVNPYLGSERGDNGAKYGLGFDIEEQMAINPVVDVKVSGGMDGKLITIKSEVTALYTGNANLGVSYVITQDSLSNPNWKQKNNLPIYYRDNPVIEKEPLFKEWLNGELEVENVVYNDVIRAAGGAMNGITGIIPTQVKEEETYTGEYTFNLDKYSKIKNTENMNLCVFVIDNNTGKIVNSAKVKLSECNAIEGVEADDEKVIEITRYTIDGQIISAPKKGINIIKFSDGTAKKVIVK